MAFTYQCYRRLKTYLGQFDAVIEVNELAIRKFIEAAAKSGDVKAFISSASKRHKITVNFDSIDAISNEVTGSYIVSVYQSAELFLHEFRSEHQKTCGLAWKEYKDQKSKLVVALKNLSASLNDSEQLTVDLFEYYRKVRNDIVHKYIDERKALNAFEKVDYNKKLIKEIYSVNSAPHKPNQLIFEDFILFSRVVKDVAFLLCQKGRPLNEQIANSFNIKPFKKFNNPSRMRKAIEGALRTRFGLVSNEINEIVELIIVAH